MKKLFAVIMIAIIAVPLSSCGDVPSEIPFTVETSVETSVPKSEVPTTVSSASMLQSVFDLDDQSAAIAGEELQKIGISNIASLRPADIEGSGGMQGATLTYDGTVFFITVNDKKLHNVRIGDYVFYDALAGGVIGTLADYNSPERSYALQTTPSTTGVKVSSSTASTASPIPAKTTLIVTSTTTTTTTTTRTTTTKQPKFVVYWGNTGDKVHISPDCRTIKNGVLSGSLDACKAAGHTEGWCGVCSQGWSDERFNREGNPNTN